MEKYLTIIKNPNIRKIISQFRVSNHKLPIERGRYENIPRDQRICKLCDSGEVEDEFHFTFKCQKFDHFGENSNSMLKIWRMGVDMKLRERGFNGGEHGECFQYTTCSLLEA